MQVSWNSLMEGMRASSGASNPAEELARQNDLAAASASALKQKLEAATADNDRLERDLVKRQLALSTRRQLLQEEDGGLLKYCV